MHILRQCANDGGLAHIEIREIAARAKARIASYNTVPAKTHCKEHGPRLKNGRKRKEIFLSPPSCSSTRLSSRPGWIATSARVLECFIDRRATLINERMAMSGTFFPLLIIFPLISLRKRLLNLPFYKRQGCAISDLRCPAREQRLFRFSNNWIVYKIVRAGNQWNDMGAGSAPWSFTHHWPACCPFNGRV